MSNVGGVDAVDGVGDEGIDGVRLRLTRQVGDGRVELGGLGQTNDGEGQTILLGAWFGRSRVDGDEIGPGRFGGGLGFIVDGKGGQRSEAEVRDWLGARVLDDEFLQDLSGDAGRCASQERCRRWGFALGTTEEAVLLAFLAEDGAEGEDIALGGASLAREQELDGWDGAESQVGEDLSEQDGVLEVGDGEIVLAGCDSLFPRADEEGVGGNGM